MTTQPDFEELLGSEKNKWRAWEIPACFGVDIRVVRLHRAACTG